MSEADPTSDADVIVVVLESPSSSEVISSLAPVVLPGALPPVGAPGPARSWWVIVRWWVGLLSGGGGLLSGGGLGYCQVVVWVIVRWWWVIVRWWL